MHKLLSAESMLDLQRQVNALGPSVQVVSAYSIHQKHFVWVKIPEPKQEKKGSK